MELRDISNNDLMKILSQTRDKAVFVKLFLHFAPRVKSYMCQMGASDMMAEDLAQKTMLQVWHQSPLYESQNQSAGAWVFTIARDLRLEALKKRSHFQYTSKEIAENSAPNSHREYDTVQVEGDNAHQRASEALSADQKDIIELSFNYGLTDQEISQKLNISVSHVKSRMRIAFQNLKKQHS